MTSQKISGPQAACSVVKREKSRFGKIKTFKKKKRLKKEKRGTEINLIFLKIMPGYRQIDLRFS